MERPMSILRVSPRSRRQPMLLPLLFVAAACGGGGGAPLCLLPPRTMTPPPSSAHLAGVVLDAHGLDCCTWLVDGSDGRRYEAPGLPKSVQKDGLWIAAAV